MIITVLTVLAWVALVIASFRMWNALFDLIAVLRVEHQKKVARKRLAALDARVTYLEKRYAIKSEPSGKAA